MTRIEGKSSRTYKFVLGGDERLSEVKIVAGPDAVREILDITNPTSESMRPGESMKLRWQRYAGSVAQFTAEVHWVRPNGAPHTAAITLD